MFNLERKPARGNPTLLTRAVSLMAILCIFPMTIDAVNLWVDKNSLGGACSDNRTRSQITASTPWCTLEAAGSNVLPGDVVRVRAGVYTKLFTAHPLSWGAAVLQVVVSGTSSNPIKFMAEPGEEVRITGAGGATYGILITEQSGMVPRHIIVEGFTISDLHGDGVAVMVQRTSDVVIRNLEVTGVTWGAIGANDSARITIEGNRVHNNALRGWTSPIGLWGCKEGNVVRGNYIWENTDEDYRESEGHGIILDYCDPNGSTLIENNVIWHNEGWCMNIFFSNGATIRNNTCWQNALGRYDGTGELSLRGTNHSVHNNLLVSRAAGPAIQIYDVSGNLSSIESDYNIFWSPERNDVAGWPPWNFGTVAQYQQNNPMGWDAHSSQVNPGFVDAANTNFELQNWSPAIDSGTNARAAASDVLGKGRPIDGNGDGDPRVDLGAYEFGTAEQAAGTIFTASFESGFEGWAVAID